MRRSIYITIPYNLKKNFFSLTQTLQSPLPYPTCFIGVQPKCKSNNHFKIVECSPTFRRSRIAAEAEVKYGTVERIFNDSEVSRKSILDDSQLSADLVEQALPLEQETVLVGYFKGEAHLNAIKKNHLYYVRTGSRRGSIRIELDAKQCKYLFLHNEKQYFLFKLTGESPRLFTGKQLMEKKFLVRKPEESYLGFDLASADPVEFDNIDIQKAIIRGIGNRTADSYFTTLKELFNL